jgi:hypothetical protein
MAVLMGLLATSCIEEEIEQVSEFKNSEIEAAKTWYDAFENQSQVQENARKVKNGKGKPDWSKSKVYHQSDGKKVIEVQFDFEEIAIPEYLKTANLEKESVLQTLILFPKTDGSYVPYFLNIYPDSPDKKFKLKDFIDGGYQKIPSDFSGVYRFYKWNGDFISGWRIKDGIKTHRIKESKAKGSNKNSRLANSYLVCYQVVTTWYKSTCWEGFGCTTPVEDGTTVSGYECELVIEPPTPGDTGGGGGGGDPTPPNEECEVPEGNLVGVTVDCDEEEINPEEIISYIENQLGKRLNKCEKNLILSDITYASQAISVYLNSKTAEEMTFQIFGRNGWNDCSDAFRHTYWNALMTKSYGVLSAILFGTAHECVSGQPNLENNMDLHNNSLGRDVAMNNISMNNSELANQIMTSLLNGDLKIISNLHESGRVTLNSSLVSSSSCQN